MIRKDEIQQLIANGKVRLALNRLIDELKETEYYNEIIMLSNNYNKLHISITKGILSSEEIRREENRICSTILDLIQRKHNRINYTISSTAKIQLIIEGEIEEFDLQKRTLLTSVIAKFLETDEENIKILKVLAGSIKIIIQIPEDKKQLLLQIVKFKNKDVNNIFDQFKIIEVKELSETRYKNLLFKTINDIEIEINNLSDSLDLVIKQLVSDIAIKIDKIHIRASEWGKEDGRNIEFNSVSAKIKVIYLEFQKIMSSLENITDKKILHYKVLYQEYRFEIDKIDEQLYKYLKKEKLLLKREFAIKHNNLLSKLQALVAQIEQNYFQSISIYKNNFLEEILNHNEYSINSVKLDEQLRNVFEVSTQNLKINKDLISKGFQ